MLLAQLPHVLVDDDLLLGALKSLGFTNSALLRVTSSMKG